MRCSLGLTIALSLAVVALTGAEVQERGWWRNAVFYQIFVRSFLDTNGDGNGDLKGVFQKINENYFTDLGVNALILTPIYGSPLIDSGHDVSDHKNIHGDYGSLKEFQDLIELAHNKSIKIVLDFVPNHTSKEHPWFVSSTKSDGRYTDFYVWKNPKNKNETPSNWMSVYNQPAWTGENVTLASVTSLKYYLHQFSSDEPDLNFENEDVLIEMQNILSYWMDKKVDGFRVNAIDHLFEKDYNKDEDSIKKDSAKKYDDFNHTLTKDDQRNYDQLKKWRTFLDDYSHSHNLTEQVLITEANTNRENSAKYFEYGSNLPLNFDLITSINETSSAQDFKDLIDYWLTKPANYTRSWVLGNHDKNRLATRFKERSDQMTMLAMLLPGVVVTYYGEEIGMKEPEKKPERKIKPEIPKEKEVEREAMYKKDNYRTPFQWKNAENAGFSTDAPWLAINDDYKDTNYETQKNANKSHYIIYREMVKLRSSHIWKNGTTTMEILGDQKEGEVLSVIRKSDEESIVLLINFSNDKNQTLNVEKYAPGADSATVLLSTASFGQAELNQTIPIKSVILPSKASVLLTMRNGAGFLMASINLVLATSLFILFKLN